MTLLDTLRAHREVFADSGDPFEAGIATGLLMAEALAEEYAPEPVLEVAA